MIRIENKRYLGSKEMTDWLGVDRKTIFRWLDRGLPGYKWGWQWLFPYEEAKKWIKAYWGYCPPLKGM